MRKGVVDISLYNQTEKDLMVGQVATLSGKYLAVVCQQITSGFSFRMR